jgi:Protein of unknown function (DUF1203)
MFIIRGLEPRLFEPLFSLSDEALLAQGARRIRADAPDAFPCRVSLRRVEEGTELILLHFAHQTAPGSPYRAGGPIFVGPGERSVYEDTLPPLLQDRLVSLRAYDSDAFIVDAEVAEGDGLRGQVERFLANPEVDHIDAHFARRGCFAARIERA